MCLVIKLDNVKVVSIANGQTDRITDRVTEASSTVLVYRYKTREPGPCGATSFFGNDSKSFRNTSKLFTDPQSTCRELSFVLCMSSAR